MNQNKISWIALACLVSCRDKAREDDVSRGIEPVIPESGVEVSLDLANSQVSVGVAADAGAPLFGAPAVIPGVHWAWQAALPAEVEILHGKSAWQKKTLRQGDPLPVAPFRMRYAVDLSDSARRGFPVVGGLLLAEEGALMLSSFLFVLPGDRDFRLKVRYERDGKPIAGASRATSCGVGCFTLAGYWDAMEVPFSVAPAKVWELGAEGDFPWNVSVAPGMERITLEEGVQEARRHLVTAWKTLGERWGAPWVGAGYRVHLLVEQGCGFQGLEHDAATLLSLGHCSGADFAARLTRLAVHEAIHVWNGKLVHPESTASWPLLSFDGERLPLLYYYEGFTEGYARILLSEQIPEMRDALRARWNSSFANLMGGAIGKSLEEISRTAPMLAYDVGAVLALRLASSLRAEHGFDEGARRFWKIHRDLLERSGVRLEKTLASQRCFGESRFVPCVGDPVGYSPAGLLEAFEIALDAQWEGLRMAHFGTSFLANPQALQGMIRSIGEAVGAPSDAEATSLGAPASENSWPL